MFKIENLNNKLNVSGKNFKLENKTKAKTWNYIFITNYVTIFRVYKIKHLKRHTTIIVDSHSKGFSRTLRFMSSYIIICIGRFLFRL